MKVPGPTTDSPTYGSGKGTEYPQGIWLWRPVGFDYRASIGLGKQTLGGHKQNLVHTRTQEKGAVTHKRLSQTCLWASRSLWQRCGSTVACHGVRGTEYNSTGISPLDQTTGKEHSSTYQQKIGLTVYWPWSYHNKTQIPPQLVPPIRKLPQASYSCPSEGRQNENHNHRKLARLITWITALYNSMKPWAMPCRVTQDRWVVIESSDKMWSSGEGNDKPL